MTVSDGWGTLCVLLADETVRCAGNNERGQLGAGTRATTHLNQDWADPGLTGVKELFVGHRAFCANIETSPNQPLETYCWGMLVTAFQLTTITARQLRQPLRGL